MTDSTYHHGNLKSALIAAARAQIERERASSLNLRALAREVGVTHPAVYRHFADKEALLEAVAEQGFDEIARTLEVAVAGLHANREAKFFAIATAYIDFTLAHPELTHVMFSLIPVEARKQNPSLYAATKRAYAMLLRSVAEVEGEAKVNGMVIWSMIHGLAQLIIGRQFDSFDDAEERTLLIAKAINVLSEGFGLTTGALPNRHYTD